MRSNKYAHFNSEKLTANFKTIQPAVLQFIWQYIDVVKKGSLLWPIRAWNKRKVD